MMSEEIANANDALSSQQEPEVSKGPSYVVHGAKTVCSMGTSCARLIVPLSHGVYLRKKAQLNKGDCIGSVNINCMGVCLCSGAPPATMPPEQLVNNIEAIFNAQQAQAKVANPATCLPCVPLINMQWQNTKKGTLIEGKEALLNCSVIQCAKGGTIIIVDDGQMQS